MIDYAIKNISKRKARSLITVIGIAVLVALVTVINGIVNFQKKVMNEHASASGAGRILVQTYTAGANYPTNVIDMPVDLADSLLNISDIQNEVSSKILFFELEPPLYPNSPPSLELIGVSAGKEKAIIGSAANETRCSAGKSTLSGTLHKPIIVGQKALALLEKTHQRKFNINDSINILGKSFIVSGILEKSADQVVNNSVIMDINEAQALLGKKEMVSSVILYPKQLSQRGTIEGLIKQMNSKVNIVTAESMSRNATEGIKLFEQMINGISIVVLVAALVLLVSLMSVTIKERTREIGVLRAIGATNRIIISSLIWELFIISLAGCILGSCISSFVLKYGLLENLFSWSLILRFIPLSIFFTLVAGVVPVIKIIKIQPLESLQYE